MKTAVSGSSFDIGKAVADRFKDRGSSVVVSEAQEPRAGADNRMPTDHSDPLVPLPATVHKTKCRRLIFCGLSQRWQRSFLCRRKADQSSHCLATGRSAAVHFRSWPCLRFLRSKDSANSPLKKKTIRCALTRCRGKQ